MSAELRISVIATVRNDAPGTRALLEALLGQTRRPDEIVIVDGGSTDGTQAMLAAFDPAGIPFRWFIAPDVNIATGRNRAITVAEHDLLACTDAGCVPDSTWLEELVAPFADPQVQVVGGGYRISARSPLERVVGLLTMPGELKPIDPLRFNPSARSLAFRKSAWQRAGGFPEWLTTAEDTLFACKLRRNRENYVYADHAVVHWRPRTSWSAVWRQFRNYARGEAHIGRAGGLAFWKRRYLLAGASALVAALAALAGNTMLPVLGVATALFAVVGPCHARAAAVVRRTTRWTDYARALWVSHWVTLAAFRGHRLGTRDAAHDPHMYVSRLRDYWGAASLTDCPPWTMSRPPVPHTLIVSWHWPPQRRASTQVLANLFAAAPRAPFLVLTRSLPGEIQDPLAEPPLPVQRLPWPLPDDRERLLATWLASILVCARMVLRARRLHRETPFQRILGVYPHRWSLLAAWLTARLLGVPLVAYMHDLCAETLITRNRLKRAFWTLVDRAALRSAFLIATPTREFALHYRSRDAQESWVLPHCNAAAPSPAASDETQPGGRLHVLYAGNVYQAHEAAVAALCAAQAHVDGVELEFLCRPNRVVPADRCKWVDQTHAQAALQRADVAVVALAANSPYPREVMGCFPSKIVDYLAAGKPILAIVPPGCFVDRFVRTTGCGVSVTTESPTDIARVLGLLTDGRARREMAACARRVSGELDARTWMAEFSARLALGAPIDPSTPPFPAESGRGTPYPTSTTAARSA